jgi:hypothetical protein
VQRRVDGPLGQVEVTLAALPQGGDDGVAVLGPAAQDPEQQQVEVALHHT